MLETVIAGTLKELVVLGVGAGPAAFDVIDAELIQFLGDVQLVQYQE